MLETYNKEVIDSCNKNNIKYNKSANITSVNGFNVYRKTGKLVNEDFFLKTLGPEKYNLKKFIFLY